MTQPDDAVWDEGMWGMAEGQRDPSASLPPGYLDAKMAWLLTRLRRQAQEVLQTIPPDVRF